MIRTPIFRNVRSAYEICIRNKSEPALNIEKLEQETSTTLDVTDEEAQKREDEIQLKRNKSRLRFYHQNMVHNRNPFPEPRLWFHGTLAYNRKMYGRYGKSSGVDPSYCWPTPEELSDKMEYERLAFPYTILEMAEEFRVKRIEKEQEIQTRQAEIAEKIKKLDQWKTELQNKVIKKENEALVAKQRKERLIDEVRRHFGYTVDPREDKFKEMLEKKEKEQRKISKEAKKKEREAKMITDLLSKKTENYGKKLEKEDANKDDKEHGSKPSQKE